MEAIGIAIDGDEMKIAHLRNGRDRITVMNVETVWLTENGQPDTTGATQQDRRDDEILGLTTTNSEDPEHPVEDKVDEDLVINTLCRYAGKNRRIGLNIPQANVSFTNISVPHPHKRNIRQQVREELANISRTIQDDGFGYIPKSDDRYLAFYHNNSLDLLNRISSMNETLQQKIKVSLLDVNEIALIDLMTRLQTESDGIHVLVYVGNEYSRVLFFQGNKLFDFSPLIHEGHRSPELHTALYGKIVAEIDMAGFDDIDTIQLAGSGELDWYAEYLGERLPGAKISRFPLADYFSVEDTVEEGDLDAYALPLSLAWKVLGGKKRANNDSNLLPASFQRRQRLGYPAWHTTMLFLSVIGLIAYSALAWQTMTSDLRQTNRDITAMDQIIQDITPRAMTVDSMITAMSRIQRRMTLVDSLNPGTVLQADFLREISGNADKINSLWMTDIEMAEGKFTMMGHSLYGSRIHKWANTFDEAEINLVNFAKIQKNDIFQFQISGDIPAQP